MDIIIRDAGSADAEDICTLLKRSITELCLSDHKGEQDILNKWLKNKTAEQIQAQIGSSGSRTIVAVTGSKIVGVGAVGKNGEIYLCYVLPGFLHHGIGKKLVQNMCSIASDWGNSGVYLTSTLTALPFYEHNGFVSAGEPTPCMGLIGYPLRRVLDSK